MKAYKIKENIKGIYTKGRIILTNISPFNCVTLATPTQRTVYGYGSNIIREFPDLVEEIDLKNEKWIHPHLYKTLKQDINN
jgi:hypothetical protein